MMKRIIAGSAAIILVIVMSPELYAQVVIKEQLEIKPSEGVSVQRGPDFVMPVAGTLSLEYGFIERYNIITSPLPASATVVVLKNGLEMFSDTILGTTWTRSELIGTTCSGGRRFLATTNEGSIEVGAVEASDQIQVLLLVEGVSTMGDDVGEGFASPALSGIDWTVDVYDSDGTCDLSLPFTRVRAYYLSTMFHLEEAVDPLTITLSKTTVWPHIEASGAPKIAYDLIVKDLPNDSLIIENILILAQDDNGPVSGLNITVEVDWIEGSGGHNHVDTNTGNSIVPTRKPPLELRGTFNPDSANPSDGIITQTTDANGMIELAYRPPKFGGRIVLKANAIINGADEMAVSDAIEVRVPGLVQLPNNPELYTLTGGTCEHLGLDDSNPTNCVLNLDENHFANSRVVDILEALADIWNTLADASVITQNQAPLWYNDISLPNGGGFDIRGTWESIRHAFHRLGRDIDIRTTRSSSADSGIYLVNVREDRQGNAVQRECKNSNGSTYMIEIRSSNFFEYWSKLVGATSSTVHNICGGEHYHVEFSGNYEDVTVNQ